MISLTRTVIRITCYMCMQVLCTLCAMQMLMIVVIGPVREQLILANQQHSSLQTINVLPTAVLPSQRLQNSKKCIFLSPYQKL